ncbi:ABA 3 protein, partial [Immersiella caudata]
IDDVWFFPAELASDLVGVPLPPGFGDEAIACGWEYARCVIPHFTNWQKYMAFCRIIIIGVIAEFRGDLLDLSTTAGPVLASYNMDRLLDTLFSGDGSPPGLRRDMGKEYRSFLMITAEKSSMGRQHSELFRRYVDALARSPKTWFRLRDCDALARFTMAAALACNDHTDTWFREEELDILTELCDTMYDAATHYKHRAEGETNNTFAYVPSSLRTVSFRICRELLWQLDTEWAVSPPHRCIINFMRAFGGPIHLMMRRYRYVEDGLALGHPETDSVVALAERNVKLWSREEEEEEEEEEEKRFKQTVWRLGLVSSVAEALLLDVREQCRACQHRDSYGARIKGEFGGVKLCDGCQETWRGHAMSFPERAAAVFP